MSNHDSQEKKQQEIVIVDDSLDSLKLLTDILQKQGYKVRPVSSASLALETVAAKLPDLILLDVKMPEMDGYEVCRLIKSNEHSLNIPVIFISGYGETTKKVEGFEAGGVDFITKPFETEEVLARVRTHLRLRELTESLEHKVHERTNELKESEERLRIIFETATDHIFIKNHDLRYTMVNPCMASFFEMSESQIIGLTDEDLFGAKTFLHLQQVDKRVLAGETIEEMHSRPVKGSLMTFFDNRAPMRDDSGNIIGICGISRDITERRDRLNQPNDSGYNYPSSAIQKTLLEAQTVARTETIVLLTGESGVGKDHLARFIHGKSQRSGGPFFSINCGAIPNELAESELFGHERGAFSGATQKKRGLFELAEGGTVLLNEIGEFPLLLQVKLLTFLDTFSFTRVGGEKEIAVDIRILAATNRNLEEAISAGRFREDLFYRLNIVPIRVPSLRERSEDIPIITQEIIDKLVLELQLPYKPKVENKPLEILMRYPWPGNVRELINAIERAIILSEGSKLTFDFLDPEMTSKVKETWTISFPPHPTLNDVVEDLKNQFIREALKQSGGRKIEAARLLGISRFALMRYLKKFSLDVATSHAKIE